MKERGMPLGKCTAYVTHAYVRTYNLLEREMINGDVKKENPALTRSRLFYAKLFLFGIMFNI